MGLTVASQTAFAGHTNPVLEAQLDGRNEVRTDAKDNRLVGYPDGSGEIYVFGIDNDPSRQTLCYVLNVEKIGELDQAPGAGRAAHIHRGAPGENGPVVANLAWPQDGQAGDCLDQTEPGKFVNGGTVSDILANPSEYYVNVHNAEYPAGALRGQLQAD
ncbi:MAG: CHRD domain-containing protein [Acidimicrobiia bacterium]